MTATVRSVDVRLDADVAAYIAKMKAAGAATSEAFGDRMHADVDRVGQRIDAVGSRAAATVAPVDRLGGSLGGMSRQAQLGSTGLRDLDSGLGRVPSRAREAGNSIDQLSGRLKLGLQAAAVLTPGIAAIGAVGVPALTGLATAAGAAAVSGGAALAAFSGVGDALDALEKARLEPTVENLQEAQRVLERLGPDAAEFTLAWEEFRPTLMGIRDAAAAGLFPGLIESLDDFERLAPRIESLLQATNAATGRAIADGAESLASDRWADFLDFLEVEIPAATTQVSRILGDLGHGASEMWMAFDPGNDSFLNWLGDVASGFDDWASSADGREDVAAFLDYVREVGPQVQDLFLSIVDALAAVAKATAPLSGPVLGILTSVFDGFAGLAGSDIGTPLLAGAAALALWNRTMKVTEGLQTRLFGQGATSPAGSFATYAREAKAGLPSLQQWGQVTRYAGQGAKYASEQTLKAREAVRGFAGSIARAAAPAAGLTLLMSGAADGFEMTNTASLALMGSMVGGVPGAVAGGLVGAFLDVKDSGKGADEAFAQMKATMSSSSSTVADWASSIGIARSELAALREDATTVTGIGDGLNDGLQEWANFGSYIGLPIEGRSDQIADQASQLAEAESQLVSMNGVLSSVNDELGGAAFGIGEIVTEGGMIQNVNYSLKDMERVAAQLQPALSELGYSVWDLANPAIKDEVVSYMQTFDSGATRLDAFRSSVDELSNAQLTNAQAAAAMGSALDSLLNPTLNAEATTDAWRQSLQQLRADLDAGAGFKGFSEAAMANRELTRSYVEGSKARLVAMAENGAGEAQMAAAVRQTRTEFIEAGIAAGFSRKEITARANAMGLTPKLVRTVFEDAGLDLAVARARDALKAYRALPKNVRTAVQAEGIPQTMGQVNALVKRYGLTEKQRRALITLMDRATPGIRNVQDLLDAAGKGAKPKITVSTNAGEVANQARSYMNSVKDRTVYLTIARRTTGAQIGNAMGGLVPGAADGATVPGPRYPYGDKLFMHVAPGEEVISNRYGQADKNREALKAVNRGARVKVVGSAADGATVLGSRSSGNLLSRAFDLTPEIRKLIELGESAELVSENMGRFDRSLDDSAEARKKRDAKLLEAAEEEVASRRELVTSLKDERDSLRDAVADRLSFDGLFGQEREDTPGYMPQITNGRLTEDQRLLMEMYAANNAATQAASPSDKLSGRLAEMEQWERVLRQLEELGLDGPALGFVAQQMSFEELVSLAAGGRREVNRFERLYERGEDRRQKIGGMVADAVVEKRLAKANDLLDDSLKELRSLKREQRENSEDVEKAVRQSGRITANAIKAGAGEALAR